MLVAEVPTLVVASVGTVAVTGVTETVPVLVVCPAVTEMPGFTPS